MDEETAHRLAEGMRRQLTSFRVQLGSGMPRTGWKIGINDPAAQQRMGIDGCLVGWLDGRRVIEAGEVYAPPPGARPRIEAEIAIALKRGLEAGASREDAAAAMGAIAPAIEFVNGAKPLTPLDELLAHDILHEAVLFGSDAPPGTNATALVAAGYPRVSLNGEFVRQGLPGRYPDDLADLVLHVANVLHEYGEALGAGDRIIGGSFIDPFDVAPGDTVEADFGPLGNITFTVA